jgi:hypothetical protein
LNFLIFWGLFYRDLRRKIYFSLYKSERAIFRPLIPVPKKFGKNIYYHTIFGPILNRNNQTFIKFGKILKEILFNRDSVFWFLKIDQI